MRVVTGQEIYIFVVRGILQLYLKDQPQAAMHLIYIISNYKKDHRENPMSQKSSQLKYGMLLNAHFPNGLYCTNVGTDKPVSDMTHPLIQRHKIERINKGPRLTCAFMLTVC
jgi:hypothetical protein